jgi:hypothetical protein
VKEYTYSGPLSGVSLKGSGDVMLHPGATVELPEDHPYTARLKKRDWLMENPSESKPQPKKEQTDAS